MTNRSELWPIPFDVLDAATNRRIEGYSAKLVEATREEHVSGAHVTYRLHNRHLGDVGLVELQKLDQGETWLHFRKPERAKKRTSATEEQYQKRLDLQRLVIEAFYAGLEDDEILHVEVEDDAEDEAQEAEPVDQISPAHEQILSNVPRMKEHYRYYNPDTAKLIYEKLPTAWHLWCQEGGRWGPGLIARVVPIESTTVGRYLKAFWLAGIQQIENGGATFEIPYRPRNTS